MKRHYIQITVLVQCLSRAEMEALFEPIADAVFELSSIIDPDLSVDLGGRVFDFNMAVDADASPAALSTALNAVRSALHSAGAATPGWEQYFEVIEETIRVRPLTPA